MQPMLSRAYMAGGRAWRAMIIALAIICAPAAAVAADPPPAALVVAIDQGLFFLQKQQKADGSFDASGPAHAMAGLGLLSFLANGHTPDVGRYGLTVRSAIDYLLKLNPEGGYYGRDGSRMYGHCIVTIALAEAYGTELDPDLRSRTREALEKALKVILDAQAVKKDRTHAGGWRYEPNSADSDLSVSAWCALALRACQNAGLPVPRDRVDLALQYILRCFRTETSAFAYTPTEQPSSAMTAAALLNLYLLNADERQEAALARRYLLSRPVRDGQPYFYYAMYYTTQAGFQAGEGLWPALWKNNSELLLAQKREDGSWPSKGGEPGGGDRRGRFYSTSMAVLTLSVPMRLLPMYQR
jgi:hypothetical protein